METLKIRKAGNKLIILTLGSALMFFLSGCATTSGRYGGLRLSEEVNEIFESYTVLEGYNYYFSGSDVEPRAIIGIHKDYKLRTKLWQPVDLTEKQLKRWVFQMTDHRGFSLRTFGSDIIGPQGNRIGIWYSPWNWTTVKLLENNQVIVHTPDDQTDPVRKGIFLKLGF